METLSISKITCERDLRTFLISRGFCVNYKKEDNETGFDVIAIKDGYSFLIEFKSLEKRDTGSFRYNGDILGDICIVSTESGFPMFILNEKTSITKTARLIEMIFD